MYIPYFLSFIFFRRSLKFIEMFYITCTLKLMQWNVHIRYRHCSVIILCNFSLFFIFISFCSGRHLILRLFCKTKKLIPTLINYWLLQQSYSIAWFLHAVLTFVYVCIVSLSLPANTYLQLPSTRKSTGFVEIRQKFAYATQVNKWKLLTFWLLL